MEARVAQAQTLAKKQSQRWRSVVPVILVIILLAGLPLAVWLDLCTISENILLRQATELNSVITSIRSYYAKNVVGRILTSTGPTRVLSNYEQVPGAIPIPATLSLELGRVINEHQSNITYRFISDYPFKSRKPHTFDKFETAALQELRVNPDQQLVDVTWDKFHNTVRLVSPVIMAQACVTCHNSHPDSPKRDWKVGDVRGIQEVSIKQSIVQNILSFKYLLSYFILAATIGLIFIFMQKRHARALRLLNRELESTNEFLASVSAKISRYLSPQVYKSIFTGQTDATIHTERHKLTIFFSDIKDFTVTTEELQPEEITSLLNEYFTEMSNIAIKHGGTIDKFIGDAMLVFFGNPETRGVSQDAKACLKMAVEMKERLAQLFVKWSNEGVEHPFEVRMGMNTGYCNVGNFGSSTRMDYTIIGAEANLAARLQYYAAAGSIIMSYETYALVRDIAIAHPLPPITMKGVSREIVPYVFDAMRDDQVDFHTSHEHD